MDPRELQLKAKELRIREKELTFRKKEIDQRYWSARYEAKTQVTENGIKGLIVVNGGAAVALGAFLQAIISKPEAAGLVPFVVIGLGLCTVGVAIGAVVFWLRYMQSRYEDHKNKFARANPWWWASWGACLVSLVLFVAGMGAVVIGSLVTLGS